MAYHGRIAICPLVSFFMMIARGADATWPWYAARRRPQADVRRAWAF
jgi:hypothetical protein